MYSSPLVEKSSCHMVGVTIGLLYFIRLFLRWLRKTLEMSGMKWMGSALSMEMNLFPVFMKILEFPLNNFLHSKVNIVLIVCFVFYFRNPMSYYFSCIDRHKSMFFLL